MGVFYVVVGCAICYVLTCIVGALERIADALEGRNKENE